MRMGIKKVHRRMGVEEIPTCYVLSKPWRDEVKKETQRVEFPNLVYAEKWFRALGRMGAYNSWWGDKRGG